MIKYIKYLFFVSLSVFLNITISGQVDTAKIDKLFEMSLTDLMNQEVVTSSRFIQKSVEAASSISVITADDIKNFNYSTLGEALNSQRGIYLSNDRNYLYAGSRGFSRPTDYNNRILIMVDGHIFNEVVYGSAFLGNELGINMKNVEKIEIVRGPGASVYGSGALLNIVNIIMKKGSRTNGVQLSAGTGSFGKNEFLANFGKKIKDIDISVSGITGFSEGENFYYPELDASETNNGISEGMDWEKYSGAQTKISANGFTLTGVVTTRSKGIPTGAFETDLTGDVSSRDDRYYLDASYRIDIKKNSSLLFRAYYDDYSYSGSYPSLGNELYDASHGHWAGSEVQYNLQAGEKNVFIAGAEYRQVFRSDYKEWDNTDIYFNDNFPFSFFSFYVHDQFSMFDNLKVTGGLRFDHYSIYGQSLSPRLAAVYSYSEASSLKLLYSEAFRIPNMYESFYESEGSHKSNPEIKAEKIRAIELAWGHSFSENFYGSLSVYRFNMLNLIDQTLDDSDGLTMFSNIGIAQGTGIEAEFRYQPVKRPGGFVNISLQDSKDILQNTGLSNSPSLLIKSGMIFPVLNSFFIVPEIFYETERSTLAENTTGPVFLVNLNIRTARFLKYFDISAKARNLFDQKYFAPAGYEHLQDALIQDRRSIFLQLTAQF
jgi:iron complex outermembrane receptor protein